jgi:AcrR family transcriptional regulator
MRLKQKARTRSDVLRAAVDLLQSGERVSVTAAASRAKVSKATAYRYFPTTADLEREAAELAASGLVTPPSAGLKQLDPKMIISASFKTTLNNERVLRAMLASSLEAKINRLECKARRSAFREALSIKQGHTTLRDFEFLQDALFFLTTIEALVVVKDECGLDNQQAEELIEWMSSLILASSQSVESGIARS